MKRHEVVLRTAALAGIILPAAGATAQYTGTSHPEDVPVTTTSVEGIRQPVVQVTVAPEAGMGETKPTELKQRQAASAETRWAEAGHVPVGAPGGVATATERLPMASDGDGDVDADVVTRVEGPANRLPEGTLIKTRLLDQISTRVTPEGTEWRAELTEATMRDGRVLLPAGATIQGKVTEIHGGKRMSGEASIHLQALSVTMPDGQSMGIHAQVIDTNLYRSTKVDSEGTIVRRGNHKQQAGVLALTAGSGAAAGAMLGGLPGAVVGAGLGAGVSGVLWLRQDRQTELPRETLVTFELTRPLAVGVQ